MENKKKYGKMDECKRRVPFVHPDVLKKVQGASVGAIIRTKARSSTILPMMVGMTFEVYNGRVYIPYMIQESMVGYKLGDFSPTRLFKAHGGDKNKERAKSGGTKK